MVKGNKMRVNITVDKDNLEKARTKLKYFGGKLSTLFDGYLEEFVKSMDKDVGKSQEDLIKRIKILEDRVSRLEKKN